jgi:hypothetical protein
MTQAANLAALGTNAGTTGILPAAGGGTGTSAGVTGFKNRIINGAMVIDQRNAGASVTPTNNQFLVDRWQFTLTQASKLTAQQNAGSVTPPAGFTNYLGVTSSSAYSVGSGDIFMIRQTVEGFNSADFNWGSANAKNVTLSFWVRSSGLTYPATFGGSFVNVNSDRSYPFTYTISAANTWEYKTVTVAGDTSGTWNTTNGAGIYLQLGLGVGSTYTAASGSWAAGNYLSANGATSVVGTNGATFYLTGVQLEVGSTATSFDYRPYGTELSLCQRYFARLGNGAQYASLGSGFTSATVRAIVTAHLHTVMRASPTVSMSNMAITDWENYTTAVSTINATYATPDGVLLNIAGSGFTAFRPCAFILNTTAGYVDFSSEL